MAAIGPCPLESQPSPRTAGRASALDPHVSGGRNRQGGCAAGHARVGHLVRGFPDEGRDGNDRDRAGAGRVCVGTEQLEPSTASVDGSDCRFPAVQNREKSKQKSCIYYLSR